MLQMTETEIIKTCQAENFWQETDAFNTRNRVPSTNSIHQLDPFLDKNLCLQSGWETCEIKL